MLLPVTTRALFKLSWAGCVATGFKMIPKAQRAFSTMTDEETDVEDKPLKLRRYAKMRDVIKEWKLVRGDLVQLMSGKEKGKRGKVLECNTSTNYIRVKGCLLRPVRTQKSGKLIQVEETIHCSRVALVDPLYKKPTRVTLRLAVNRDLLRISKLSGAILPWPDKKQPANAFAETFVDGPKDTLPEIALEKTFSYEQDKETRNTWRRQMSKFNYHIVNY